ncbi:MAG: YitT family protein [Mycoplasmoidaceae bacterium]
MKDYNKRTDFNFGKYELRHLHAKPIPFAKLYLSKNVGLKYTLAALTGVIYSVLALFFVKNTGAFTYGLSSLMQGFAKLFSFFAYKNLPADVAAKIYSAMFWGLLLIANIPLFIFSWKKIGHRFTMMTLVFLVSNSLSGFLLDLIPGIGDISLFGSTELWCNDPEVHAEWIHTLNNYHIQILPFSVPQALFVDYHPANYVKPVLLILSTVTYAFIASFVFAVLFIVGGSTAGTDFISVYLSGEKKKSVGTLFFALNFVCITVASALGTFTPACLAAPECASSEFFFNANWVGTIISLLLFTFLYKGLYPTGRRCRVEVYSPKAKKIRDLLYKNNYVHGSSIVERIGGYSNKKQNMLITICSAVELPMVIDQINQVDRESTITISRIEALDGPFNLQRPGSF